MPNRTPMPLEYVVKTGTIGVLLSILALLIALEMFIAYFGLTEYVNGGKAGTAFRKECISAAFQVGLLIAMVGALAYCAHTCDYSR